MPRHASDLGYDPPSKRTHGDNVAAILIAAAEATSSSQSQQEDRAVALGDALVARYFHHVGLASPTDVKTDAAKPGVAAVPVEFVIIRVVPHPFGDGVNVDVAPVSIRDGLGGISPSRPPLRLRVADGTKHPVAAWAPTADGQSLHLWLRGTRNWAHVAVGTVATVTFSAAADAASSAADPGRMDGDVLSHALDPAKGWTATTPRDEPPVLTGRPAEESLTPPPINPVPPGSAAPRTATDAIPPQPVHGLYHVVSADPNDWGTLYLTLQPADAIEANPEARAGLVARAVVRGNGERWPIYVEPPAAGSNASRHLLVVRLLLGPRIERGDHVQVEFV